MKRLLAAVALSVAGAAFCSPASAIPLLANSFSSTINLSDHSVTFDVGLNRTPDFLTRDGYGRMADQLQFWIDSTAFINPVASAYERIAGGAPPGTQTMVIFDSIPDTGELTLAQLMGPPAPNVYGGWTGTVLANIPFTLDAENNLSFTLSLVMLGDDDGLISYTFETYSYGATGGTYIPSGIPEPSTYALMLAGLGVLGTLRRRRRLPDCRA